MLLSLTQFCWVTNLKKSPLESKLTVEIAVVLLFPSFKSRIARMDKADSLRACSVRKALSFLSRLSFKKIAMHIQRVTYA